MKKPHFRRATSFQKKPRLITTTSLILALAFGVLFCFGLPALVVASVVLPSATSMPVSWKIAAPFLVIFIGWWFYNLYRGTRAVLARREAKKKEGIRKAWETLDQ